MRAPARLAVFAFAALVLGTAPLAAQAYRGGHGNWHGHSHWGVSVGIGFAPYWYGAPWGYYYPGYVLTAPTAVYPVAVAPAEPAPRAAPEPVIYPRNGQSAAQTEADHRDCNRWAMTQPSAMRDASVFQRATVACMEGRGYTVR